MNSPSKVLEKLMVKDLAGGVPPAFSYYNTIKFLTQALSFCDSNNVAVRDIEIMNSPQCHLIFDSSSGIKVDNITINSPKISRNTDGIHLQNTKDVEIHHSNTGCVGDQFVHGTLELQRKSTSFESKKEHESFDRMQSSGCPIQSNLRLFGFWVLAPSFHSITEDACVSIQTGCHNIHDTSLGGSERIKVLHVSRGGDSWNHP
uniref:Uncharacterized protein n=1 Tax=Salix viminalis TaxID=40686 RepID=A0A6N2N601_SALVM